MCPAARFIAALPKTFYELRISGMLRPGPVTPCGVCGEYPARFSPKFPHLLNACRRQARWHPAPLCQWPADTFHHSSPTQPAPPLHVQGGSRHGTERGHQHKTSSRWGRSSKRAALTLSPSLSPSTACPQPCPHAVPRHCQPGCSAVPGNAQAGKCCSMELRSVPCFLISRAAAVCAFPITFTSITATDTLESEKGFVQQMRLGQNSSANSRL